MALTRAEPRWPSAFDHITCPVCGGTDWTEQPHQGTFCDECNVLASLRPTCGDRGFVVDFDAAYCWDSVADDHRIPESDRMGRKAYAKYMGAEENGYSRAYLAVYAIQNNDVSADSWTPAWGRNASATPA